MIIFRFMGLLDLLTVLFMILYQLGVIGSRPLLSFFLYLIAKTFLFWGDNASLFDGIIAIYILVMFIKPFWILTIISSIYLGQKGLLSVLM